MTTEETRDTNTAASDGERGGMIVDVEKMVSDDNHSVASLSQSRFSTAVVEAEQKRLKHETAQKLAARENRAVFMLRILVMTLLLIVTAVVLAGVYVYSSQSEQKAFEDGFTIHATQLTETFRNVVERKLVAIGSMSNAITSHATFYGSEFPFVTLPDFAVRASDTRLLADALVVAWCPLVTDENRLAWEEYAFMNRYHINEAFENDNQLRQEQDEYFEELAGFNTTTRGDNRLLQEQEEEEEEVNPDILQDGTGYSLRIYNPVSGFAEPNGTGPYLPGWQRSPVNFRQQQIINLNWAKAKVFKGLDIANTILKSPKVIINKLAAPQPKFFKAVTANLRISQYRNRVDAYLADPLSFVVYPVFDSFNSTTRKLGGVLIANLYWRIYFESILPSNAQGIICVLSNSYNQTFSYLVNGHNASLLGPDDFHDPRYDDMGVTFDISSFVKATANPETRAYMTVPLHDTIGLYTLKVYPTDETKKEYTTSNPALYTLVVGLIFLVTALVFVLFDTWVEKRQRVVMKRAVESGAIVNSLFPEEVQERLYEDEPSDLKEEGKGGRSSWKVKPNQSHGLGAVSAGISKEPNRGGQIADAYENCTVIFSDLAGFTAWSSSRTPCEVFELLETLYNAIDAIALRRKVFKVETIGDCWLGVCGLPNPNPKHAVVTARFADDCQKKVAEIVLSLAHRLGLDTQSLQLRTGLHSGSVTAGVLRGQKSRFQLFGDTVNTASRMETTGQAGRIHASQATANELIAAGKGAWLKSREDKVLAKGKGEMHTYWIDPGQDSKSVYTTTTETGNVSSVSGVQEAATNVHTSSSRLRVEPEHTSSVRVEPERSMEMARILGEAEEEETFGDEVAGDISM